MFKGKTILIAPLDWGLGHATRCVPIVRELMAENTILLGVTPLTKQIFDEEFPLLKQIELPSYQIEYSTILPLWLKLGLDSPRISGVILEEHNVLETLIEKHKIDVVISDSRFGLHSKKIQSIFISHQLFLKTPLFNMAAQLINKNYILKFDEVWVPDFDASALRQAQGSAQGLSGELSHGEHYHKNIKYIGPQSRLKDVEASSLQKKYDILLLLSGPEPLRTALEKNLVEKFETSELKIALVRGKNQEGSLSRERIGNIDVFDLPKKEILKPLILNSKKIICRSGYSTLMDMHVLGKTDLILIPTPGQTEQEYLAEYWEKEFNATSIVQNKVSEIKL